MDASQFDKGAETWDDNAGRVLRADLTAKAIIMAIPHAKGATALEYGSGTGLLSFCLRDFVGSAVMADFSAGMLEVADRKIAETGLNHFSTMKLDLMNDPVPEERFSLIYTMMSLHHIPDIDGILAKFSELLLPGGHLCIADLETEDGSFHGEDFVGHNGFDTDELSAQLEKAGMTEIRRQHLHELERERDGKMRKYGMFLLVGEKL